MFIISGGKGTGKTRTLLERAKAENGIVVCQDPEAMRTRAYKYGIVGLDFVSYDDDIYITGKPVFIHDINKFIEHTLPEATGYTLCIE
jgi:hypothetical protein